MKPTRIPRLAAQRGAAALIVVMLLFLLISLVAAYSARSLIFEQKTSVNQYRSTQAFDAAEAGLEWALALLNGGRVDGACAPLAPPDVSQTSFRQRYLDIDVDGRYTPRVWAGTATRERPSCVQSGSGWSCSCPTGAAPTPTLPTDSGVHPAFRVCFEALNPPQPGAVRVVATGGTTFAIVDRPCEEAGEGAAGEAAATVSVVVALSSALPAPPLAALTAVGDLSVYVPPWIAGLTLVNTDPQANGLTANLGGSLTAGPFEPVRVTVAGSSVSRSSIQDSAGLGAQSAEELFKSMFRMHPDVYKGQPSAVVLNGCASPCSEALRQTVQANPGRVVWVSGDLALSTELDLETVDPPALIVASGNVDIYARARIRGLLLSLGNLNNYATDTRLHGAVVAAGNVQNFAPGTTIEYDPVTVRQLRLASGSLVRVPGSWRDFP